MLAAINFDRQRGLNAQKIYYKWPDSGLRAKFETFELTIAQYRPDRSLNVSHIPSKAAGMRAIWRRTGYIGRHYKVRKALTQPSPVNPMPPLV